VKLEATSILGDLTRRACIAALEDGNDNESYRTYTTKKGVLKVSAIFFESGVIPFYYIGEIEIHRSDAIDLIAQHLERLTTK